MERAPSNRRFRSIQSPADFAPDDTQIRRTAATRAASSRRSGTSRSTTGRKQRLTLVDDVYGDGAMPHATGSRMRSGLRPSPGTKATSHARSPKAPPICGSGYYHGVLERSLVNVRSRTPAALASCREHALRRLNRSRRAVDRVPVHPRSRARAHDRHRPRSSPSRSMSASGSPTRWDRDACKGGVFMENVCSSLRLPVTLAPGRRPRLSMQLGRLASDKRQVLPDGDLADPPGCRGRLEADG